MPVPAFLLTLREQRLRGRGIDRRLQVLSLTLLVVTLMVAGEIVLSPGAPAPGAQRALHHWSALWRMTGVQPTFLTFDTVEWLSNVLMFVPIGVFFAGAVLPGRRFWMVPVAAVVSGAVETAQLFLPGRVPSMTDLAANTVGAALGVVLLVRCSERWAWMRTATARV